ncbi:glycosyltransferase [Brachyspira intermedia]|uniref:glycosyltransferase n=1 Tax=Brachyspira intermedia TaxID=84377 RepID=UPI0030042EB2
MPLVSVIIPTFNRKDLLKIAIESVLKQSYSNIEIIVTDNASSDGTCYLMEDYTVNNNCIKYIKRNENIGPHKNALYAYKEYAKGKYVFFLSDDDYLCDMNFISEGVEILENNSNISIITGMISVFSERENKFFMQPYSNIKVINGIDFLLETSTKTMIGKYQEFIAGFALIRKEDLDNNPAFEWFEYGDTSIRFYHLTLGDIYFIDRTIGCYRLHNNDTGDSGNLQKLEDQIPNICKFIDIMIERLSTLYPDKKDFWKEYLTNKITDNTIITILDFYMYRNNKLSFKTKRDKIKEICNNTNIKTVNPIMYNYIIKTFFHKDEKYFHYIFLSINNKLISFDIFSIYRDYQMIKFIIFGIKITIKLKLKNIFYLDRGAYANKDLEANSKITASDIYYSLDIIDGQLVSKKDINNKTINKDIKKGSRIMLSDINF